MEKEHARSFKVRFVIRKTNHVVSGYSLQVQERERATRDRNQSPMASDLTNQDRIMMPLQRLLKVGDYPEAREGWQATPPPQASVFLFHAFLIWLFLRYSPPEINILQ